MSDKRLPKSVTIPSEPTRAMLRASLSPWRRYLPHVAEKLMAHNRKVWIRMVLASQGLDNPPGI